MADKEDAAWTEANTQDLPQPPRPLPLTTPSQDAADNILADLKDCVPLMRGAYMIWVGYVVQGQITNTVVLDKAAQVNAYLSKKPDEVQDDDTYKFIGAVMRIALESGKDALAKLTPLLGRDAITLAVSLGLLTV